MALCIRSLRTQVTLWKEIDIPRMDVSVIICTRNRAEALDKTLQSLCRVKVPAGRRAELLLVNNGSTDLTPQVISDYTHSGMEVRTLSEPRSGKSNALNRGVQAAQGHVLLFTDDDVRFPENWLEAMSRPIIEKKADAVAGTVTLASHLERAWMKPAHRSMLASTETISSAVPNRLVGANMAIARSVFSTIPAFDPELGPGRLGFEEETLFAYQMHEANFEIVHIREGAVEHHPTPERLSTDSFRTMAEKLGHSEGYLSYHWANRQWPAWKLYAGWAYYRLQLLACRLRGCSEMPADEGISLREFDLRRKSARVRQHLKERGTSPKYTRRGIIKRTSKSGATDDLNQKSDVGCGSAAP